MGQCSGLLLVVIPGLWNNCADFKISLSSKHCIVYFYTYAVVHKIVSAALESHCTAETSKS